MQIPIRYLKVFLIGLFILVSCIQSFSQVWKPDYDTARAKFNRGEIEATAKWLEDFIPVLNIAPDKDTVAYYEMINLLGRCYMKQGYNVNAEEMFKEDVDYFKLNASKSITKKSYSSSLIYLGYLNYNLKKYPLSYTFFEEVLKVKSELNELKKNQKIALTNNLATISNMNKEYVRADSLYTEVIKLKRDLYGQNSIEVAKTLTTKGILCKKMGRYSEAEPLYKQALDIRKARQGEKNSDYIYILNRMADLYKIQGRYAELENLFKQINSLSQATYGKNSLEYSKALSSLADLYRTLSRYNEAEPLCLQALQIINDTLGENNLEYTRALLEIATLYKDMNKFKQSEIYFLTAISIYEVIVGVYHESYVKALVSLASLYRTMGKTAEAEPLYLTALDIYKKTSGVGSMSYADLLNDFALYFDEMGHYEQAELQYKKCLEITLALKGGNDPNYASTLDNLANHYLLTGHIEQAEPIFIEAARIRKDRLGKRHPLFAASLNNVANLYESTGRYSEAKIMYQESIDIIKEVYGEKNYNYANAIDNLADVYQKEGNYPEAERLVKESMRIINDLFGDQHIFYTTALNNLALIKTQQNNPKEAEELYKLNIQKTKVAVGEEHPSYASSLANLADLYESLERYKESEELYEKAMKIRKDKLGVNHRQYTSTLSHLAGLYSATNDFDKADQLWESSLNNYLNEIKLFFPSMSEKEKQQFYKTIYSEFEQFNSYALMRCSSEPLILTNMYNNQLATKALILNSSNKVRQKIVTSRDTSIINVYKNWLQQKEVLSKLYSLSKEEVAQEGINIDSLEALSNRLEKRLSLKSEAFKNSNDTITYSWKHVQKKLKDGEAAIEMIRFKKFDFKKSGILTDSIYYVALIVTKDTKKSPDFVVFSNGNELEKRFLNYYKNVVKFKIDDEFTYTKFWEKINEKLPNITKVYFSPDGVYNQINLNTIKNPVSDKYVLEEMDIQIVSNTKDLVNRQKVKKTKKQIAFFGNPNYTSDGASLVTDEVEIASNGGKNLYKGILLQLPGTEKEVASISTMMKDSRWNVKVSLDVNANEKALKSISNPRILHIATHGFFDKDVENEKGTKAKTDDLAKNKLLRSGLMLAGASITLYNKKNAIFQLDKMDKTLEDGILTAYEAMNLNLDSTDLVVLSACETGLGDVENGEGVYGLQRAFIIAGAESIVLSLWKVDDATTQKLMTLFYEEWLKTGNRREAFRSAQLKIKQEFKDPYYWGAFVMVGN